MPTVGFLGATGYIGGTALVSIRQAFPDFDIHALVRNPSNNAAVTAAGASRVVNAPIAEAASIFHAVEATCAQSDIVVQCASSDDLPLTEAVLRGLKTRFEEQKRPAILVHTSGVGVFLDGRTDGKFNPDGKVYDDDDEENIKDIFNRPQAWHANCDIPILKAGQEGYVSTYFVAPGVIYGRGTGPVGKAGGIGPLLKTMKEAGAVSYVGDGSSVFGAVHIADLSILYPLVLRQAIADSALPSIPTSPFARYYLASVKDLPWNWVMPIFGEVLYEHGLIPSSVPKSLTAEELGFFGLIIGGNSRTKAVRAIRDLGWAPKEVTKDMVVESMEEIIHSLLS